MISVTQEKSFKRLHVWQRSVELANEIYKLTNNLPATANFGLSSQMRRSAISVPSNIAEGYKRKSTGQYLHFLNIAEGSIAEPETQLIICKANYADLEYGQAESLLVDVQKMLFVMIRKLPR